MTDKAFEEVSTHARVTDRGLERYEELAHFDLKSVPDGAVILNIGSGTKQTFEREVKQVRPGIKIISIDPSLALSEYVVQEENKSFSRAGSERSKARIASLGNKEGTVVALGQELPIQSNSIDLALDIHGPAQYTQSWEIYKDYLKEVVRVLKPGGKFHISHVFFGDPIAGDEKSIEKTEKEAKQVFDDLGLKAEVFRQKVGWAKNFMGREVPDIRVGAIVTKEAV